MHLKRFISGLLLSVLMISSPFDVAAADVTASHPSTESTAVADRLTPAEAASTGGFQENKTNLTTAEQATVTVTTSGKTAAQTAQLLKLSDEERSIKLSNATNDLQTVMDHIDSYNKNHSGSNRVFRVKLPKATYVLGQKTGEMGGDKDHLVVFANTTLDLSSGATLKRHGAQKDYNMIRFGNYYTKPAANLKNISILGGTIDNNYVSVGMVRFCHASKITFKNVTFLHGYDSHCIEFADCSNVLVDHCKFRDSLAKKSNYNKEALQMEVMNKTNFDDYPPYNHRQSRNITVQNCLFDNVKSGLGTHKMEVGTYFNKIIIRNNTFRNLQRYAVYGLNWRNSKIYGNHISKCGGGIRFWSMIPSHSANVYPRVKGKIVMRNNSRIYKNDIRLTYNGWGDKSYDNGFGIDVYGENIRKKARYVAKGDYRLSRVTVSANRITSSLAVDGIRITGVVRSNIYKNRLSLSKRGNVNNQCIELHNCYRIANRGNVCYGGYNGLLISNSKKISAVKNTMTRPSNGGIVAVHARLGTVQGNKIISSRKFGVVISKKSMATKLVQNRVSATRAGFYFGKKTTVAKVFRNRITGGHYGILVREAHVTRIYRNTIRRSRKYGIKYRGRVTKPKIYFNVLVGCGHHNKIKK